MTTRRFSVDERRARLARRHHLLPSAPAADVEAAARRMVGLHATDPATVYLSAWARVPGLTVADVERSLYDDLTVMRHLCMRRTLFVVPHDLVGITQAATTNAVAARMRKRLAKELVAEDVAVDGERWLDEAIAATIAAIAEQGPSTGAQLAKAVPLLRTQLRGAGPAAAAVTTRVVTLAAAEGHLERGRQQGSWTSSTHRWRLAAERPRAMSKAEATIELVQRWLFTFGPAPTTDLMWWTGLGATEVNAAVSALGVVKVDLDGQAGVVLIDDVDAEPAVEPWVALLPSLDSTAMGWKSREWYVGDHAARVFDRSGNIGPTVWSDGRIVGGWAVRRGSAGGTSSVVFELFEDVGRQARQTIEARAGQLEVWLEGATVTPRFPTPVDRDLRA